MARSAQVVAVLLGGDAEKLKVLVQQDDLLLVDLDDGVAVEV